MSNTFAQRFASNSVLTYSSLSDALAIYQFLLEPPAYINEDQGEILERYANGLKNSLDNKSERQTFAVASPGFGKTHVHIGLMDALNKSPRNKKRLFIWVTLNHRTIVSHKEKLDKFAPGIFAADEIAILSGAACDEVTSKTRLIIATPTMFAKVANGEIEHNLMSHINYNTVFMPDETHVLLTELRSSAVNQIRKADCLDLGLTATPAFSDGRTVGDIAYGGKAPLFILPTRVAVQKGYNCSIGMGIYDVSVQVDKAAIKRDLSQANPGMEKAKLKTLIRNKIAEASLEGRIRAMVTSWGTDRNPYTGKPLFKSKTIDFLRTTDAADEAAALYNKMYGSQMPPGKICAASFHSKLHPKEQARLLAAHKKGDIYVLTNVRCLSTAHDDDEVENISLLLESESELLINQEVGRALRFNRRDPQKFAFARQWVDLEHNPKAVLLTEALDSYDPLVRFDFSGSKDWAKAADREQVVSGQISYKMNTSFKALEAITKLAIARRYKDSGLPPAQAGYVSIDDLIRILKGNAYELKARESASLRKLFSAIEKAFRESATHPDKIHELLVSDAATEVSFNIKAVYAGTVKGNMLHVNFEEIKRLLSTYDNFKYLDFDNAHYTTPADEAVSEGTYITIAQAGNLIFNLANQHRNPNLPNSSDKKARTKKIETTEKRFEKEYPLIKREPEDLFVRCDGDKIREVLWASGFNTYVYPDFPNLALIFNAISETIIKRQMLPAVKFPHYAEIKILKHPTSNKFIAHINTGKSEAFLHFEYRGKDLEYTEIDRPLTAEEYYKSGYKEVFSANYLYDTSLQQVHIAMQNLGNFIKDSPDFKNLTLNDNHLKARSVRLKHFVQVSEKSIQSLLAKCGITYIQEDIKRFVDGVDAFSKRRTNEIHEFYPNKKYWYNNSLGSRVFDEQQFPILWSLGKSYSQDRKLIHASVPKISVLKYFLSREVGRPEINTELSDNDRLHILQYLKACPAETKKTAIGVSTKHQTDAHGRTTGIVVHARELATYVLNRIEYRAPNDGTASKAQEDKFNQEYPFVESEQQLFIECTSEKITEVMQAFGFATDSDHFKHLISIFEEIARSIIKHDLVEEPKTGETINVHELKSTETPGFVAFIYGKDKNVGCDFMYRSDNGELRCSGGTVAEKFSYKYCNKQVFYSAYRYDRASKKVYIAIEEVPWGIFHNYTEREGGNKFSHIKYDENAHKQTGNSIKHFVRADAPALAALLQEYNIAFNNDDINAFVEAVRKHAKNVVEKNYGCLPNRDGNPDYRYTYWKDKSIIDKQKFPVLWSDVPCGSDETENILAAVPHHVVLNYFMNREVAKTDLQADLTDSDIAKLCNAQVSEERSYVTGFTASLKSKRAFTSPLVTAMM